MGSDRGGMSGARGLRLDRNTGARRGDGPAVYEENSGPRIEGRRGGDD